MKSPISFIIILLSLVFVACTDDITDMGKSVQPTGDKLVVASDTFTLNTESFVVPYMYCRSDSFLLGSYYDELYGTTQADILAQFQPPIGFSYPQGAVADSMVLGLHYLTWRGDDYSPMEVSVYEMNKDSLSYSKAYKSNIDPNIYTDKSILLGKKTLTARDGVRQRIDTGAVYIKLSDNFVQKFAAFNMNRVFTDNKLFLRNFRGAYITTNFGSSTILNINQIDMLYYFHYKFQYLGKTDSVATYMKYPANREVRQINRILHPDTTAVKQRMLLPANAGLNYISSPANIYTRVNIPLKSMVNKMNIKGKKLMINSCLLRVDVVDNSSISTNLLAQRPVPRLMVIKESQMNDFFKNKKLPADTVALVGSYSSETDASSTTIYYYSYDLSTLVANELYNCSVNHTDVPDQLKMVLVPVSLKYDTNSNISGVQPQNLLNAVTICGGNNVGKPMKLKVTYSGF